jgi:hypothetical protein
VHAESGVDGKDMEGVNMKRLVYLFTVLCGCITGSSTGVGDYDPLPGYADIPLCDQMAIAVSEVLDSSYQCDSAIVVDTAEELAYLWDERGCVSAECFRMGNKVQTVFKDSEYFGCPLLPAIRLAEVWEDIQVRDCVGQ